jgi:cephalosporin hydroxylase
MTDAVPDILRPPGWHRLYRRRRVRRLIARHFHRAYYYAVEDTVLGSHWLGTTTVKLPLDMWIYQEIISELRPALVIETGTYEGGSALYLASVMDQLGTGRMISIDIQHPAELPRHPRIEYVLGSSVDAAVVGRVRAVAAEGGPVLVILDSDHARDHVAAELAAYADLVTPGSYCIVEDTNVNNHPVLPHWGPGPMEAVEDFLAGRDDFAVDPRRERLMLTMNPRGYLRRVR